MSDTTRDHDPLSRANPQFRMGPPARRNGSTGGPNTTATGAGDREYDFARKDSRTVNPAKVIAMLARLTRDKAQHPAEAPTIDAAIRELADLLDGGDRPENHVG